MSDASRRDFLQASIALAAAAPGAAAAAPEDRKAAARAYDLQLTPTPLPFDPKSLRGLSDKLVQSHWENNYGGAVKALNAVRGRLTQALGSADTPAYVYNGLKREQLLRTGSVVLHESYFENLGGDGKAGAELRSRIAESFGTFDAWEKEFRTIGNGLGGGSGWVVLGYNEKLKVLENCWMADHSTSAPWSRPVLVMDMYEHAYQMDYGAAAAKYIDAFFANINWDAVARRL